MPEIMSIKSNGQEQFLFAAFILILPISIWFVMAVPFLFENDLRAALITIGVLGSILSFGLIVKYFRQTLLLWYFLAPFYYLPYFLTPTRGTPEFGGENFWLRAAKDAVVTAIFAAWLLRQLLKGRFRRRLTLLDGLVFCYIIFGLLRSLGLSTTGTFSVLRMFVEYTLFFFIAQDVFVNEEQIRRLIKVWLLSSLGVSLLGIYEYFSGGINQTYTIASGGLQRIVSTLYHPNALGWYLNWINGLALGLYLFAGLNRRIKRSLLIVIGLNSGVIVLTGSRSALVVLVITALLAIFVSGGVRKWCAPFLVASSMVVFILLAKYSSDDGQLRVLVVGQALSSRIEAIGRSSSAALNLDADFLWGVGDMTKEGSFGYIVVDPTYLNVFFMGGIAGVTLFCLILFRLFSNSISLYLRGYELALPFLFSSFSVAMIGFGGNVLTHFPLAMFFWTAAGVVNQLPNRNRQFRRRAIRSPALTPQRDPSALPERENA